MPVHTDWKVSKEHRRVILDHWPDGVLLAKPEIRKTIDGVRGKRIGEGLRAGIWMKPLGRQHGMQFSSVHDVTRSTFVICVSPSSTKLIDEETDYEIIRDLIFELFDGRRATCLQCENISRVAAGDYDIDDAIARKYDVDQMIIASTFREDRVYYAHN